MNGKFLRERNKFNMKVEIYTKFLAILVVIDVVNGKNVRLLRNRVSDDEIITENLCVTKVCLLDVAHLLESASDQEFIEPCDDFKEFALGKFLTRSSLNDRSGKTNKKSVHKLGFFC